VDLDGTLVDSSGRRHIIDKAVIKTKDWEAWHKQTHTDKVIEPIKQLCYAIKKFGIKVIFLTARSDKCRKHTEAWIAKNIPRLAKCKLLMRTEGDFRPSAQVKLDIFTKYIGPIYEVLFTIDDDAENIKMFNKLGVHTLQVKEKK